MKNLLLVAFVACIGTTAYSQTIDPFFAGSYSFVDLGSAPGVPANYGGITVQPGNMSSLVLGGAANGANGAIYDVGVTRQDVNGLMRITGFSGSSTQISTAPNIDGGLTVAPNGSFLYTGYSNNIIGEIKQGSTTPDRITTVTSNGIASSVGSLVFVPGGTPGAGRLKVLSYSASTWYDLPYAVDGSGLYTFGAASAPIQLIGGLEGAVYVPGGSPLIANPSVLVAEYGNGVISIYDIDGIGDPIAASRRVFMSGLGGAEGAMIDPTTGDFLFSTFGGGNRVIAVRGFAPVPEPATFAVLGLGLAALARKRKASRK